MKQTPDFSVKTSFDEIENALRSFTGDVVNDNAVPCIMRAHLIQRASAEAMEAAKLLQHRLTTH